MEFMPAAVKDCLTTWFHFPDQDLNCQVSTTSKHMPHIRTMHLADITAESNLIFLSHIETQKWYDLIHHPHVAICLHHENFGQILIEGDVKLKHHLHASDELSKYWRSLPMMFKKIYLMPMANISDIEHEIPEAFGVITVKPTMWEILRIDKRNFVDSSREQYLLLDNMWIMQILEPV